jgi:hypothetical protein
MIFLSLISLRILLNLISLRILKQSPSVEPHVEPATLNAPEPAASEATSTEVLVDEPTSYLVETTGYIPPPVIDSTAGNPGAFTNLTDELPQPVIAQDPHAVAPVEPHATLNAPEPAESNY